MPTNGMTIDSLNTVSSLTAQDEVPVWDKEASGEHTRKITAQNMTNSVKTLGSLVNTTEMNNAIAQSTADVIRTGDVVNSLTRDATKVPSAECVYDAITPSWTTLSTTYGVEYCKMGNLVAVKVFKYSPGISSGTVIATLPSGYRPPTRARFPGYNSEHEYDIDTDGTIKVNGNAPNLMANIVFMM